MGVGRVIQAIDPAVFSVSPHIPFPLRCRTRRVRRRRDCICAIAIQPGAVRRRAWQGTAEELVGDQAMNQMRNGEKGFAIGDRSKARSDQRRLFKFLPFAQMLARLVLVVIGFCRRCRQCQREKARKYEETAPPPHEMPRPNSPCRDH